MSMVINKALTTYRIAMDSDTFGHIGREAIEVIGDGKKSSFCFEGVEKTCVAG